MAEAPASPGWNRLAVIAGGGDLPVEIAHALADSNPLIVRLLGSATDSFDGFESIEVSVGQIGTLFKALKAAQCDAVCFAGYVSRPNFKTLKVDAAGLLLVPKAIAAGRDGDDAMLRTVIAEFEKAGFAVIGANDVLTRLTPAAGILTACQPGPEHQADIDKALHIARHMGELDIGQAAIVGHGVVLAVESQEGTNAMIERVHQLPGNIRAAAGERLGVLAKAPKPIQERRIDLPTIGLETVERCISAGLAGIALEAGGALILDREAVIRRLDAAGLFLVVKDPAP